MQVKVNDPSYQLRHYFPTSEKHINFIQETDFCNTLDDDSSAIEVALLKWLESSEWMLMKRENSISLRI